MADNLKDRGEPDRSLVNLKEPWEIDYWTKRFGCTPSELKDAVKKVGDSADKVKKELKK